MKDRKLLTLTEETAEKDLYAQEEPLLHCCAVLPKLQPLSPHVQRRIARYTSELERRWKHACEGWLLTQAGEAARMARHNALPFSPLESALTGETTYLDDRFWSILWRWQVTWQGEPVFLRQWGLVWDVETGLLCRLEQFLPAERKTQRQAFRQLRRAGWRNRLGWFTLSEAELVCGWTKLANPTNEGDFFTLSFPFSPP